MVVLLGPEREHICFIIPGTNTVHCTHMTNDQFVQKGSVLSSQFLIGQNHVKKSGPEGMLNIKSRKTSGTKYNNTPYIFLSRFWLFYFVPARARANSAVGSFLPLCPTAVVVAVSFRVRVRVRVLGFG